MSALRTRIQSHLLVGRRSNPDFTHMTYSYIHAWATRNRHLSIFIAGGRAIWPMMMEMTYIILLRLVLNLANVPLQVGFKCCRMSLGVSLHAMQCVESLWHRSARFHRRPQWATQPSSQRLLEDRSSCSSSFAPQWVFQVSRCSSSRVLVWIGGQP